MGIFKRLWWLFDRFFKELTPFVDLFARVWVARLLMQQVLQQVQHWNANVFAFQSSIILIVLTVLEGLAAIFLALGLGGRVPAFITFLILLYSVATNSFLWQQEGYLLLQTLILWGVVLIILMTHGPQLFSLDKWIGTIIKKRNPLWLQYPKGIVRAFLNFERLLGRLSPIGDLIARVWIARIFLWVGLSRIQTWSTTLFMFWYVYQMPPPFTNAPNVVAILTTLLFTGGTLFLLLGIGGRLIPFFMFKVNLVSSVMIPFLRTHEGIPALNQHVLWGLVLMMMMTYGPGSINLDNVVLYIYQRYPTRKSRIALGLVIFLFFASVAYLLYEIMQF